MITTIRITNPDEARTAVAMIEAYLALMTNDEAVVGAKDEATESKYL